MTRHATERTWFAPRSHRDLDRGVHAIVDAIRPTLGPIPRTVGIERPDRSMTPELLDNGAKIAQRIIALPNIHQDPGAMYVRGMLWRLSEDVGDGTATAAVFFAALLAGGRRAIASGIPAQPLRTHLERIAKIVSEDIATQARPGSGLMELTSTAQSVCHDPELAALLADVTDVIGETGQIDTRLSRRHESWREFVQGSYWESGLLAATTFGNHARQRTDISNAAILVSNLAIDDPRDMVAVLEALRTSSASGVLILGQAISPALAGLLNTNSDPDTFPIVAMRAPIVGQHGSIEDIARMTGARPFLQGAGDTLKRFKPEDFGHARSAWVTREHFGIIAGQGTPSLLRDHIDMLHRSYRASTDKETGRSLRNRLGKFQGMSATIWIGGDSDLEAKGRQEAADRSIRTLRLALRDGVVPGAGLSLIQCQANLRHRLSCSNDTIEQAALRIVIDALQVPAETILQNCGYEAPPILAQIARHGGTSGFDVVLGKHVDMHEAGIVDPVAVIKDVLGRTIRSAALALTIDVLVHTHQSEASINPG